MSCANACISGVVMAEGGGVWILLLPDDASKTDITPGSQAQVHRQADHLVIEVGREHRIQIDAKAELTMRNTASVDIVTVKDGRLTFICQGLKLSFGEA